MRARADADRHKRECQTKGTRHSPQYNGVLPAKERIGNILAIIEQHGRFINLRDTRLWLRILA
jgi:hypothetical protein